MKLVILALIVLQASLCLCEIPAPGDELKDKYDDLRTAFYKRLSQAYNKVHEAVAPLLEESERGKEVKGYIGELQKKPEFESSVKILKGLVEEAKPLVERVRLAGLGLYEKHARPYVGKYLDDAIKNVRASLESAWPAEH